MSLPFLRRQKDVRAFQNPQTRAIPGGEVQGRSNFFARGSRAGVALVGSVLLLAAPAATAFPPAPHYSIYGDVRDEYGFLIQPQGATVVIYFNAKEVARYPITSVAGRDYSYEIKIRLDMNRAGTALYNSRAVDPGASFSLAVDIGGVLYLPIEVATPPTVGAPAGRRRLDLTLGADTNKDGLPDAWQELQLYNAGLPITDLWRITPNGDLDGDGISNFQEYIAGTFASAPQEKLYLTIKSTTPTVAAIEFFAITNKVYTIDKSNDLKSWTPVNFSVGGGASAAAYTATGVGVVSGSIPRVAGETKTFYRLDVR